MGLDGLQLRAQWTASTQCGSRIGAFHQSRRCHWASRGDQTCEMRLDLDHDKWVSLLIVEQSNRKSWKFRCPHSACWHTHAGRCVRHECGLCGAWPACVKPAGNFVKHVKYI